MRKKHPIYTFSRSKAHKTQQIFGYSYRHREISGSVPLYDMGVDFSLLNNFANLGSFAKVSVPVETIIPWLDQRIIDTIGTETRQILSRMFVTPKKKRVTC